MNGPRLLADATGGKQPVLLGRFVSEVHRTYGSAWRALGLIRSARYAFTSGTYGSARGCEVLGVCLQKFNWGNIAGSLDQNAKEDATFGRWLIGLEDLWEQHPNFRGGVRNNRPCPLFCALGCALATLSTKKCRLVVTLQYLEQRQLPSWCSKQPTSSIALQNWLHVGNARHEKHITERDNF